MARTPSTMMTLGTQAPAFTLPDVVSGNHVSLETIRGSQGTLVIFMCNHCPFVTHIIESLTKICNTYSSDALGVAAISCNDVENYPQDSPDKMAEFAGQYNFKFPYLYDEPQTTAKAYDAACTPDFFLFDTHLKCVYRGQFDDSRPGNDVAVTGNDLVEAIEDVLGGKAPNPETQKPSLGCNIKWKNS